MAFKGILITVLTTLAHAALPVCPAGMPLGNVHLSVKRGASTPLPWRDINRLEEGDSVLYRPVLRANEKRNGKVAIVLIASKQPDNFTVLEPKEAKQPAEWKVPFRVSLAVFVYGPNGLSTRKLRGLVAKDQDLVSQLADYAEKTEQTENLLQALSAYDRAGASDNLQAALSGFSSQYGLTSRLDRTAPLEQQTMQLFRSLNPALSAYDPMAPSSTQRLSQTAGLATAVAGMFLGSSVGVAAGGTAMALNLKTIIFPNTDFRSSYVHPSEGGVVSVCGRREGSQGRTRLAYMWARRLPDTGPPSVKIESLNNVPRGHKAQVRVSMPEEHWKLVARAREWTLDKTLTVRVTAVEPNRTVEIEVPATAALGTHTLGARWDWDDFVVSGELLVRDLASFESVRPLPESQNRLRQHNGKQVVRLEGADFQFVEKVQIVPKGDKYARPADVPFSLPTGLRSGEQTSVELQLDTSSLKAGAYSLLFLQQDGRPRPADLTILPDPPSIENLPIVLYEGDSEATITLKGRELDSIISVEAEGVEFTLRGKELRARSQLRRGTTRDIRLAVKGYPEPIVLTNALQIGSPRPRIVKADVVLPADLPIVLRAGELPAGLYVSAMLHVERTGPSPKATLTCGGQQKEVEARTVQTDRLFLSFDPGVFASTCALGVSIGRSDTHELGRVVRLPTIASLHLRDEAAGEGLYYATLTGRDLELIEKTGWTVSDGVPVSDLPTPVANDARNQSLRVKMPWPSPSPRSPLFVWLRGETEGRASTVRP